MVALGVSVGVAGGSAVYFLTRDLLGGSAAELAAVIALVLAYMTLSFPKRLLDSASLSQSREAPVLAVMGSANAEATHSRTRSLLYVSSGEPSIAAILKSVRVKILLGYDPASAFEQVEGRVASYSVRSLLRMLASGPSEVPEAGEESQGITQSTQLSEESKLPLFIAVAFFAPIMLLLLVIFSHINDPTSLAEVVALEVVLLDVALYFSSAERQRLA